MRKVMLWSREPWERVDDLGHGSMPPGRYVSGITRTPVGEVTVIGTCIPWRGSRAEARRESERKRLLGGPRTLPGRSFRAAERGTRPPVDRNG